jgi:hypothetical protein
VKRDLLFAVLLAIAIVGVGSYMLWPGIFSDLDKAQHQVMVTQARIAEDRAWLRDFPRREKEQRLRLQPLNIDAMTSSEGSIEERFTEGFAALLARNRVGFRQLTMDATFAPDPSTSQSSAAATPPPPAPVQAAQGIFVSPSPAPIATSAASGELAVRRRAFLTRERVTVDIVAPYAQSLETIAELSGLPVLTEVTNATMSRDAQNDASGNPAVKTTITMYVYRLVRQ